MKTVKKIERILVLISLSTIAGVIMYIEYDGNNIFKSLAIITFWLLWLFIGLYSYYIYTNYDQKNLDKVGYSHFSAL